jgi:cytochrome b561
MVVTRYTRTAMVLHWLVAALILGNLVIVWTNGWYPKPWVRPSIDLHKSIGLTVLGLVLLRILWRIAHRPPPLPEGTPRRERLLSHAVHLALYAIILGLPLSGYIHDSAFRLASAHPLRLYGVIPFPRIGPIMRLPAAEKQAVHDQWFAIHGYLAYGLYALFGLHIAGVVKHQFLDRRPVLFRMLPSGRTGTERLPDGRRRA